MEKPDRTIEENLTSRVDELEKRVLDLEERLSKLNQALELGHEVVLSIAESPLTIQDLPETSFGSRNSGA